MSNPIDNIPPHKRGNPAWVEGGPSPNPGGRPKRLVEIERMLDAEFRTVEEVRENMRALKKLAIQGVTNDVFSKDGALIGEKTTFNAAYMGMLLDRTMGPVRELPINLDDASDETLEYLRAKLRQ